MRRMPPEPKLRKKDTVWFEPKLTAKIEYRGVTEDGWRHPSFKGFDWIDYRKQGLRYPSDLTDNECAIVAPMIPPVRHGQTLGQTRAITTQDPHETPINRTPASPPRSHSPPLPAQASGAC